MDELKRKLQDAEESKSAELATMTQELKEAKESSSKNEAELVKSTQALATQTMQNLDV